MPFGIIIPHVVGSPIETASGWKAWYWWCLGRVIVFVPFIFTMHGYWSPKKARAAFNEHEARIADELRKLSVTKAA